MPIYPYPFPRRVDEEEDDDTEEKRCVGCSKYFFNAIIMKIGTIMKRLYTLLLVCMNKLLRCNEIYLSCLS